MPPAIRARSKGWRLASLLAAVALCGMLLPYRLVQLHLVLDVDAAGGRAVASAPAAERLPSRDSLLLPEVQHFFNVLNPLAQQCDKPLGAPIPLAGLQPALQACLGRPACLCVAWDEQAGTAQLGSGLRLLPDKQRRSRSGASVVAVRHGCAQPPCAPSAAANSSGTHSGLDGCPPGLHAVSSVPGGVVCHPCVGGYCGVLPGAELLPASVLNKPLQAALAGSPHAAATALHGINPSVVCWGGRRLVAARATDFGNCPAPGGGTQVAAKSAQAAAHSVAAAAGHAAAGAVQRRGEPAAEGDADEEEDEGAEEGQPTEPIFHNYVTVCDLGAADSPLERAAASRCRCGAGCGGGNLPLGQTARAPRAPPLSCGHPPARHPPACLPAGCCRLTWRLWLRRFPTSP